MDLITLSALFGIGGKLIDKLFPDPEQKAKAQFELFRLQQAGDLKQLEADLQLALGQLRVNEAEAASPDWFRAGWRPAVGWTCALGLAYQFLLRPLLTFALALAEKPMTLPSLELDTLMTLLFGMLGLGAYRTVEKLKGFR